jgi:hypothetical protein
MFKQQIQRFKERVSDTRISNRFSQNAMAGINLDLKNDHKLSLGITRRQSIKSLNRVAGVERQTEMHGSSHVFDKTKVHKATRKCLI